MFRYIVLLTLICLGVVAQTPQSIYTSLRVDGVTYDGGVNMLVKTGPQGTISPNVLPPEIAGELARPYSYIYVDKSYTGGDNNGSPARPYSDLMFMYAIDINDKVIVTGPGSYSLLSPLPVSVTNVTIICPFVGRRTKLDNLSFSGQSVRSIYLSSIEIESLGQLQQSTVYVLNQSDVTSSHFTGSNSVYVDSSSVVKGNLVRSEFFNLSDNILYKDGTTVREALEQLYTLGGGGGSGGLPDDASDNAIPFKTPIGWDYTLYTSSPGKVYMTGTGGKPILADPPWITGTDLDILELKVDGHIGNNNIHLTTNYRNAINAHMEDDVIHITGGERTYWNSHVVNTNIHLSAEHLNILNQLSISGIVSPTDLTAYTTHINNDSLHFVGNQKVTVFDHINDGSIHVTQSDKNAWLSHTNNWSIHLNPSDRSALDNLKIGNVPEGGWRTYVDSHISDNNKHLIAGDRDKLNSITMGDGGVLIPTEIHDHITNDTIHLPNGVLVDLTNKLGKVIIDGDNVTRNFTLSARTGNYKNAHIGKIDSLIYGEWSYAYIVEGGYGGVWETHDTVVIGAEYYGSHNRASPNISFFRLNMPHGEDELTVDRISSIVSDGIEYGGNKYVWPEGPNSTLATIYDVTNSIPEFEIDTEVVSNIVYSINDYPGRSPRDVWSPGSITLPGGVVNKFINISGNYSNLQKYDATEDTVIGITDVDGVFTTNVTEIVFLLKPNQYNITFSTTNVEYPYDMGLEDGWNTIIYHRPLDNPKWVATVYSSTYFDASGGTSSGEGGHVIQSVDKYPIFTIPLGGGWTDFEIKASTNNFVGSGDDSMVYFYCSWRDQVFNHSPDVYAKVWFTDDYSPDVRMWWEKPYNSSILLSLADPINSSLDYVIFSPSKEFVDSNPWLSKDNNKLVWSYLRVSGSEYERNKTGTKTKWRPISPTWEPKIREP